MAIPARSSKIAPIIHKRQTHPGVQRRETSGRESGLFVTLPILENAAQKTGFHIARLESEKSQTEISSGDDRYHPAPTRTRCPAPAPPANWRAECSNNAFGCDRKRSPQADLRRLLASRSLVQTRTSPK